MGASVLGFLARSHLTLNPKLSTLNPKLSTLNPKLPTLWQFRGLGLGFLERSFDIFECKPTSSKLKPSLAFNGAGPLIYLSVHFVCDV